MHYFLDLQKLRNRYIADGPSVQHVVGDSAVLHPVDVSEPAHAPLAEQSKHTGCAARSLNDGLVRGVIQTCLLVAYCRVSSR